MRKELHELIDKMDDVVVESIYQSLTGIDDEQEIIAYSVQGKGFNKQELSEHLDSIMDKADQGESIPLEVALKDLQS